MAGIVKFYNIGEYNGWSKIGDNGTPHVDVVATSGDDWYQIGNEKSFHHGIWARDIHKRHNRGNIGALSGEGQVTIDMGDGDDRIDTGMNAYDGKVDPSGTADPGNIWGNANISMGNGDDIIHVGKPIDPNEQPKYQIGGANIHGATIDMGDGEDYLSVFQDVDGKARIDLGNGDDAMNIGGEVGDIIDGNNSPIINAGEGDDRIYVAGNLWAKSVIDMGDGNNELQVKEVRMWGKALFGDGSDNMTVRGDVTENAFIKMDAGKPTPGGDRYFDPVLDMWVYPQAGIGGGDDVLNVGGSINGLTKGARVDMGAGHDIVNVANVIGGTAQVDMGAGNDVVNVGDGIVFEAKVNFGEGNDTLNVKNNITWKSIVDMGDGDNVVNVGKGVVNWAKIKAGSGEDNFTIDHVTNNAIIDMGDGDNHLNVKNFDLYAQARFGDGDDTLNIADSFGAGAVQDRIALKDSGAKVWMGDGNDTVIYGGKTLTGVIHGGEGKDTIILNYDKDDSLVAGSGTWFKETTNLSTLNIKGFEEIVMQGNNVVDVKYEDLLSDSTREGALFIQGNNKSKVDLGGTNWNSDTESDAWLKEYSPLDPLNVSGKGEWTKTGSDVVDGVSYDVYHHSFAGADVHNDVYIQQGVMVI